MLDTHYSRIRGSTNKTLLVVLLLVVLLLGTTMCAQETVEEVTSEEASEEMIETPMEGQMGEVRFEFDTLIVHVPPQTINVRVRRLQAVSLEEGQAIEGEYIPGRIVGNFHIVDDEGGELEEFSPPFEMVVPYTAEDWDYAENKGSEPLLLHLYNGEWVPFTQEKHQFELIPNDPENPKLGGIGRVEIAFWGDPTIAWGP